MSETNKADCQQCGACCDMGTLWCQSEHPLIRAIYPFISKDLFSDDGKCNMLDDDNKCIIHKYFGKQWKPDVCQEYPFDGEPCTRPPSKPNAIAEGQRYTGLCIGLREGKEVFFRTAADVIEQLQSQVQAVSKELDDAIANTTANLLCYLVDNFENTLLSEEKFLEIGIKFLNSDYAKKGK